MLLTSRRALAFFLFLVAARLASGAAADEKLELRLRLKQGEVYRLKLTVDQHVVQTPPAAAGGDNPRRARRPAPAQAPQATNQMIAIGYTIAVDDVAADGAMAVTTKYEAVLFRQKGPAGTVEYDSSQPPKVMPPAAKAFAALQGLSFRMTLTPDGGVKSVERVDEMLAELVRRLDLTDGPDKAHRLKLLTDQFGEAAMKQRMQSLFALYPPRRVAVGESWDRRTVVDKGLPMVTEARYTLKAREAGVAEVAIEAKVRPNGDAAPVELGTGKMTYELSGGERGVAKVDETTGWTRSLATEQDVGGTLRFDTPGENDLAVPISVKSKVTMGPAEAK